MKQLKKKSNDLTEIGVVEENEGSDFYTLDELEDLKDLDVTLSDGLDDFEEDEFWTEEEMEDFRNQFNADDALDDFSEEEIQELINEIPEEEESIEEALDIDTKGEFVFEEAPVDEEEDFVVGIGVPLEETVQTPNEPIQPKRLDEKQVEVEDPLAFRKGPLWQYRTNNRKND